MRKHGGKKIAILGSGYGYTEIFPVLSSFNDVHIYLMLPRDPSRLLTSTSLAKVELVSFERVLEDEEIGLVFLALPPSLQLNYYRALSNAGKSVYLEKPAGLNETEAREIASISKLAGTNLYLGFQFRFDPGIELFAEETQKMRELDSRFKITVNWQIAKSTTASRNWKQEINLGGGVYRDHLCHVIDYIRHSFKFEDDAYIDGEVCMESKQSELLDRVIVKSDRININIERALFENSQWSITIYTKNATYIMQSFHPFDLNSYKFHSDNMDLELKMTNRSTEKKQVLQALSPQFDSRKHALRTYIERVLINEEYELGNTGMSPFPNIFDAIFTQKVSDKLLQSYCSIF